MKHKSMHLAMSIENNETIIIVPSCENIHIATDAIKISIADDEFAADGEELGYEEYKLVEIIEVFRAIRATKFFTDNTFDKGVDAGAAAQRARQANK